MLDEIIDYVKFLQLQVKVWLSTVFETSTGSFPFLDDKLAWFQVLSMSRLGSPGAVLPLLTESQTEVPNLLTTYMNSCILVL